MNRDFVEPLVIKQCGGAAGGGWRKVNPSHLTDQTMNRPTIGSRQPGFTSPSSRSAAALPA
ncbi:MAG: hypothetical protein Q8L91_07585 [Polaromonas sp.]|nr:hypothetical protein [Polaromonas sp.]